MSRLFALLALLLAGPAFADEASEVQKLLRGGDAPGALQRAERGVAAAPGDAKLRFLLGVAQMDLRQDPAAMATFERLTEDFPELAEPFNNIALLHARAGRLDEARIALETALRNDPTLRAARRNLGDVHLQLAIRAWDAVLAETPGDSTLQRRVRAAREALAPSR